MKKIFKIERRITVSSYDKSRRFLTVNFMKSIIEEKWDEILEYLKVEHAISVVSFRTWLQPLEIYKVEDGVVTILINDTKIGDSKKFISTKFGFPLKVSIEEITGEDVELVFILASEANNPKESKLKNRGYAKKETIAKYPFLNPKYTFDTFVVGSNNTFAHAACLAVAESPAEIYNPLFIYGGVGLGKTHLMHSIAHFILEHNSDTKVLYVTSEMFTNELIEAIKNKTNNSIAQFRNKYRNIDVLLIDDIQFIIGKESTQEEFFHTFNALHEYKKQIIISSDKPPKDIETLEERLRSRFEWGLTVDIYAPDYETRMAILRKKKELDRLDIDDTVMQYVANNVKSNIRELEGALTKIVAYSKLRNKEINIDLAKEALKDLISPDGKGEITIEFISNVVSDHFGLMPNEIFSTKKSRNVAYPRQICMYLCRKLTEISLADIGKEMGNRDHTTVLHGINKIEADLKKDKELKKTIGLLIKKINPQ